VIIIKSHHKVKLRATNEWRRVDTFSARHTTDDSASIAHNYPSQRQAERALNTFRYAAHQQGA
jgi:hypothetical protein